MNLFVVGSSGRTGILVVEEALQRGHHVSASTRRPDAIALGHPHLRVARGDGLSAAHPRCASAPPDGYWLS